jgi:DNA mismatch endonuclease, patch repair protein
MDSLSKEHRSWNMSRIRNRDTKPEKLVRSILHRKGYRFRLHRKDLPGKPDIVLPRYKKVILVHGCFWHRHKGCHYAYNPKSRQDFWQEKFKKTVRRDQMVADQLKELGWQVHVIWECETKDIDCLEQLIDGNGDLIPSHFQGFFPGQFQGLPSSH